MHTTRKQWSVDTLNTKHWATDRMTRIYLCPTRYDNVMWNSNQKTHTISHPFNTKKLGRKYWPENLILLEGQHFFFKFPSHVNRDLSVLNWIDVSAKFQRSISRTADGLMMRKSQQFDLGARFFRTSVAKRGSGQLFSAIWRRRVAVELVIGSWRDGDNRGRRGAWCWTGQSLARRKVFVYSMKIFSNTFQCWKW